LRVVHDIVIYGQEVLRHKAHPVPSNTREIKTLVRDMLDSMYAARGVGLAAEQIGREEAVCVIDVPAESEKPECVAVNAAIPMPLVLINPAIAATTGQQRNDEGCLSFPEISVPITRAMQVTVTYLDLDGKLQTAIAQGLLARAIQHETDHLNGVLLVDRMSAMQRLAVAGKLKRLQAEAREKPAAK
jgi:peptide deformylase